MSAATPEGPVDPWIGRVLAGRYTVLRVLGEGGMGRVYLAEQRLGTTGRKVALKTLHQALGATPEMRARFERECETVCQLSHPNTIQVYDFGTLEGGTLFIVMEYVEGRTLAEELTRGPLDVARVDRLLLQIAGSLAEAHGRGIIHRDLKPENILLTDRSGQRDFVKVLDFGIAKRASDGDAPGAKLTQAGTILGTPPYMSPEQFVGQPLDARTDVYSLGVIAYEMLTGRRPFQAEQPWEWATAHLTAPPAPIESHAAGQHVPPPKRAAVLRALAKNRDARPPTVEAFVQEFTGYLDTSAAWTLATSSDRLRAPQALATPVPPGVLPPASLPPAAPVAAVASAPTALAPPAAAVSGGTVAIPQYGPAPVVTPFRGPGAGLPPAPGGGRTGLLVVGALAVLGVTAGASYLALRPEPVPRASPPDSGRSHHETIGSTTGTVTPTPPVVPTPTPPPPAREEHGLAIVHYARGVAQAGNAVGIADGQRFAAITDGMLTLEVARGWQIVTDGGPGADLRVLADPSRPARYRVEVKSGPGSNDFTTVADTQGPTEVDLDQHRIAGTRLVRISTRGLGTTIHLDAVHFFRQAPGQGQGH